MEELPPTWPFLLELAKSANVNRIIFLGLLTKFDVKGKLSGKYYTSNFGQPVDITGHFVQELGYTFRPERGFCNFHGYREYDLQVAKMALNCCTRSITREIDRIESTNESIKLEAKKVFDTTPLDPIREYCRDWRIRGRDHLTQNISYSVYV